MLAAVAVFGSTRSGAEPHFVAAGSGDWFDDSSWSSGTAPNADDDPVIDNGATATASSASPFYPGSGTALEAGHLAIGSRLDGAAPADAGGALMSSDVPVSVAGDLSVGVIDVGPRAAPGTVSGALSVIGGSQTAGDVSVAGLTQVGVGIESDGSTATGVLTASGDLETTGLRVGVDVDASASGEVEVGGDLRVVVPTDPSAEVVGVQVGVGSFATGGTQTDAIGSLTVDGDLALIYGGAGDAFVPLYVGQGRSAGHSEGYVEIGGDVVGSGGTGFGNVLVGFAGSLLPEVFEDGTIVSGELRVGGSLGAAPVGPGSGLPTLDVGVTRPNRFGENNVAQADGRAIIGSVSDRSLTVGWAGGGPATGVVEIGTVENVLATVGRSTSDYDAHGSLVAGGSLDRAEVGVSEPFIDLLPLGTGHAEGTLIMTGSGLVRRALVGSVDSNGSAVGYLEVAGVGLGSPSTGRVQVGVSTQGAGTAEGHMVVRSAGIEAASIDVGVLRPRPVAPSPLPPPPPANATVTGLLESSGSVTSLLAATIGYAGAESGGHADGTWILHDGTLTAPELIVGVNEGAGSATGLLHLDRVLADVDELLLGDGATLELEVHGLARGSEYSALDAAAAFLDGELVVDFVAPPQQGVYDLIVSASLDGIAGGFDAVSISGLAAGQQAYWGTETSAGTAPVEVFRLHVVPEPDTITLLAIGLFALGTRRVR